MQDTAKNHKRLAPDARKQQLLDIAANQLATQRYLPLSYEAISLQANVSTPLVYNYFPDQSALCDEIAKRELLKLHTACVDVGDNKAAMIAAYLGQVVLGGPIISTILFDPSMRGKLSADTVMLRNSLLKKGAKFIRQETCCTIREALLALLSFLAIPDELAINIRQGSITEDNALKYARQLAQLTLRTLRKQS